MRSPGELRILAERGLRVLGIGALVVALVQAARAPSTPAGHVVPARSLPALLAAGLTKGDSLVVATDTALDPVRRDWLAAARAAGHLVRWGGRSIPATAVAVEPAVDPAGGDRVLVAAPAGSRIDLADGAGPLDSATAEAGGATFFVPALAGGATVTVARQRAGARAVDSVTIRRVLVVGRPRWETKFVIAALEERGWPVDAQVPLAPDAGIGTAGRIVLDTARTGVVVVLDPPAPAVLPAAALLAFVRRGGGVVLGPEAATAPELARLRVGRPGDRRSPRALEFDAADPLAGLALVPIDRPDDETVALERRDRTIAIGALRMGAGRVVQVGYADSWRWRMTGPDGSVAAHRVWWASLIEAAGYRPYLPLGRHAESGLDDAPRARMFAALGAPDTAIESTPPASRRAPGPRWWLLAIGIGSLALEVASRRFRGAS